MELKEFTEKTKELFQAGSVEILTEKVFDVVKNNDYDTYEKFCNIVKDLNVDWMQKIYQYYLADRKEKSRIIHRKV
ncbi:hypothetical protein [Roseburia faecis]|uniref:hypothetical protein n=1 Tax=Roseburia faecis TaxID=301302 RepID=UPI001A9B3F1C|nr:hypothetical protein [Roseburia faecis]